MQFPPPLTMNDRFPLRHQRVPKDNVARFGTVAGRGNDTGRAEENEIGRPFVVTLIRLEEKIQKKKKRKE